jgi:hypothetical protein
MKSVSVKIGDDVADIHRAEYVFAFIGIHLGIKFEFNDEGRDILYGKSQSGQYGISIPCDNGLLAGQMPSGFAVRDKILILAADIKLPHRIKEHDKQTTVFNFDIIASILYLLSRAEEYRSSSLDEHGRFEPGGSVLYRSKMLLRPIIGYYLEKLKKTFDDHGIEYEEKAKPTAILSHDVDLPIRSVKGSIRWLWAGKGDFRSRWTGLRDSIRSRLSGGSNPYWNFQKYVDVEKHYGFRSAFYFAAPRQRSKYDPKYDIREKKFIDLFGKIIAERFEIGLHGSYNSLARTENITGEKTDLESATGGKVSGFRAHYLRLNIDDGFQKVDDAGFMYDSSMGYAKAAGFRCGTGLPFFCFDLKRNRALPLVEIPFAIMDKTLFEQYNAADIRSFLDSLISEVAFHRSAIGFLWHICSGYDIDFPEWFDMYEYVLEKLSRAGFRAATPGETTCEFKSKAEKLGYSKLLFGK